MDSRFICLGRIAKENTDCGGEQRRLHVCKQICQHLICLIMNKYIIYRNAIFTNCHNFQLHLVMNKTKTLIFVLSKNQGVALLTQDLLVISNTLFSKIIKYTIIIDNAVLKNLYERGTMMVLCPLKNLREAF